MTADPTIECPKCGETIKLTESLAAPVLEAAKRDFKKRLEQQEDELRQKAEIEATKRARQAAASELGQKTTELAELQRVLEQRDQKLAEAQKAQAEAVKKEREFEDKARELDLTVAKQVGEQLSAIRGQARVDAEREIGLKVAEKEQTIAAMQQQLEAAQRKAEQGSEQLQGEAFELHLEEALKAEFPHDTFEPVPKGIKGADIMQRVGDGLLLWELKRTKTWSPGWLPKLRHDQRTAKADIPILVSRALPDGVETFDLIDGVWVVDPSLAIPVATALRHSLIELAKARAAGEGVQTKAEMVYEYLTGNQFRARVEAIVEAFKSMREDLEAEKRAITKHWAKRERQLENVMQSTAGLHGDLEAIAGKSVQEIEGLEMRALTDGEGGDG